MVREIVPGKVWWGQFALGRSLHSEGQAQGAHVVAEQGLVAAPVLTI